MNELLTVQEVADFLRTTSTTIYRWLKNGKLQGVKIGKEWRIPRVTLSSFEFDFNEGIKASPKVWEALSQKEHLLGIASSRKLVFELEASFFNYAFSRGNFLFKGCWWQERDEVLEAYARWGFDAESLVKEGLLEIVDLSRAYAKEGIAGPLKLWNNAAHKTDKILWASGAPAIDCCNSRRDLLSFESSLNQLIKDNSIVGICPYAEDDLGGDCCAALVSLMAHHSGTILISEKGQVLLRRENDVTL